MATTSHKSKATVTVVSGVSRGLGYELLEALAGSGRRPIGIGRAFAAPHLGLAAAGKCVLVGCDLSDHKSLEALDVSAVPAAEVDRIVFINNAGVVDPIGPFDASGAQDLASSVVVNIVAPIVIAGKLLAAADARHARLVVANVSSGAAIRPLDGLAAYCAGKSGARIALDCLAEERPDVVVEHIDPGVIDTDMQSRLRAAFTSRLLGRTEFLRYEREGILKHPRDVAVSVLRKLDLT